MNHVEIVCHICRPLVLINIGGPCSFSINVCVCVYMRAQLYLILCNPMDRSTPGSSVHGIFQARIPDWVAGFLFQGIFSTQGSNPYFLHLLHYQADSLPLGYLGRPLVLKVHLNESITNEHQEFKVNNEKSLFLNPEK